MHLSKAFRLLIPVLLAAGWLTPAAAGARPLAQGVPFERLGNTFIEAHCGTSVSAQDCDLQEVLERDFARIRLGAVEFLHPLEGLEAKKQAEGFREIARGTLDLQAGVLGWLALDPEVAGGLSTDVETLGAWIDGWSPAALGRLDGAQDTDLLVALAASEAVVEAAADLKRAMADRAQLGLAPQFVDGVKVLLCPTRREFMQTLGYVGLQDPEWRNQHWIQGADQWTQFWKGEMLVLALEYAPWSKFDPEFRSSLDPKRLDKGGALQHALNQVARAYLFRVFNRPELAPLERSLAANLVIETAGRIMVLDGEGIIQSSGGRTQPYSRFVPGGNPDGGVLPPISAAPLDHLVKSQWREGKGEDRFIEVLREGQADGAKVAKKDRKNPKRKDKLAHFLLASDSSGEKWVVSAPFLGELAAEQTYPPAEFLNDYREFFKSYLTAFHHWLRTEGIDEDPTVAAERYARFLRELASPGSRQTQAQVLDRVYELPTSARDGEADSLEWRFLRRIADKKRR